jgi:WD40 repeat protein
MSRVWALSVVSLGLLAGAVRGQETPKGVGVRSGDKADEPVLSLETGGHTAVCRWLEFTPDGRTLISLGDDKVVRLWDVSDPASPRLDRSLRLQIGPGSEGMLYAGAVSPDGRWLAVGGYPSACGIKLLDLTSGEVAAVLRGHSNVINGLAFSPDGAWLASASSDQTLRVWDVGSVKGELRSEKDVLSVVLKGHSDDVYGVAWLPVSPLAPRKDADALSRRACEAIPDCGWSRISNGVF